MSMWTYWLAWNTHLVAGSLGLAFGFVLVVALVMLAKQREQR